MLKLTITLEENDTGIAVGIESGNDEDCKKSSNREYILAKMIAESCKGIAPVLARAAESEEIARAAKPLLKSFFAATKSTFGKDPNELIAEAKAAHENGKDLGEWLAEVAKQHENESKGSEGPAPESREDKPDEG